MTKALLAISLVIVCAVPSMGQDSLSRVALTTRDAGAAAASARLPLATLTVPADTEARIEILSGIHSRVSHVDDPIEARLLRPVFVNGKIALPYGTLIEGHITHIQTAGRMRRPAELAFRFDRVSLPDGQTAPFTAVLSSPIGNDLKDTHVDNEGNLKGSRGISWKGLVGGIGAVGSLVSIKAAVSGASSLAYALPVGGAALIGYELLSRGTEVHVPPETEFKIRLSYPVTVKVRG